MIMKIHAGDILELTGINHKYQIRALEDDFEYKIPIKGVIIQVTEAVNPMIKVGLESRFIISNARLIHSEYSTEDHLEELFEALDNYEKRTI